jgi:DNA-nicking Smr family endonuclease
MSVPTFEQRRANIQSVDDLDNEVSKSKLYIRRLKKNAKEADTLESKIEIQQKVKVAEGVLRKLRTRYFDIEDELTLHIPN